MRRGKGNRPWCKLHANCICLANGVKIWKSDHVVSHQAKRWLQAPTKTASQNVIGRYRIFQLYWLLSCYFTVLNLRFPVSLKDVDWLFEISWFDQQAGQCWSRNEHIIRHAAECKQTMKNFITVDQRHKWMLRDTERVYEVYTPFSIIWVALNQCATSMWIMIRFALARMPRSKHTLGKGSGTCGSLTTCGTCDDGIWLAWYFLNDCYEWNVFCNFLSTRLQSHQQHHAAPEVAWTDRSMLSKRKFKHLPLFKIVGFA